MRTAPVPTIVRDGATVAWLVISIQFTATAAATPTPPPELPWLESPLPVWVFDLPFASVAWSFAFGSVPVFPEVFGLLPFTLPSAALSAELPDDDSPLALACTSVEASTS